jgi:hypothetical protein
MGFLYVCRQDTTTPLEFYRVRKAGDPVRQKSALRAELEEIGLSESVIQTAESGLYTDAQLEKLKRQKLELKQTISDLTDARHTVNAAVALEEADRTNRPSTDGASSSTAQKEPVHDMLTRSRIIANAPRSYHSVASRPAILAAPTTKTASTSPSPPSFRPLRHRCTSPRPLDFPAKTPESFATSVSKQTPSHHLQ